MKITCFAAMAAIVAGSAVGLAAPASAELLDGTYEKSYAGESSPPVTVVFTSCGDGCKRGQTPGAPAALDYHLQGGIWTANLPSGSVWTIDNNSLAGSADGLNNYQLVKVG